MTLYSISHAASFALVSAFLALLLIKSARFVTYPFVKPSHFCSSIMTESAQRLRNESEKLRNIQITYTTLLLIFTATFFTAYLNTPVFGEKQQSMWQGVITLLIVFSAAGYSLQRLFQVSLQRHRLRFVMDATIAVGQSLQVVCPSRGRIFHDVSSPGGMIDHVLVGSTGIYLIDVVARRPGRDNYVRLVNDHLTFASSKTTLSIVNSYTKAKQLSRELRGIVGHPVRVRTVVAVPGWEIASQASDEVLLINEHSVGMMRGWKDERDHLSGDDVEIIQNHLAGKKDS